MARSLCSRAKRFDLDQFECHQEIRPKVFEVRNGFLGHDLFHKFRDFSEKGRWHYLGLLHELHGASHGESRGVGWSVFVVKVTQIGVKCVLKTTRRN